jgi:hypothetical protein
MALGATRRVTAATALLFWIGGILLQAAGPHVSDTAAACRDQIRSDSHSAARITSPTALAEEHCPICHLQRAVRSAMPSATRSIEQAATWIAAIAAIHTGLSKSDIERLPSRAPPSSVQL